ncbi:unnamed protein product [Rotaria sordida]|uniref:F-box domain-containing protein n=1 Tax=Rotaria sordida TaxID=392033 RepID=A0A819CWD9_9BILA|nr:unnamed protein product [Rotaria sordida]
MTKAQFLDLPNELFPFIFQYLNSTNLIKTFFNVESLRIQTLIQSFLSHLDISQETDQWIQTYLPILFNQYNIIALRLQDKHINLILKNFLLNKIQSIHLFSSDWNTDLLKEGLNHFRQCLKQLSITFTYPHGKGDIASHLFQCDCQLEHLNITGRFLFFDNNDINTCTRLTYLSIGLEGMYRVFILIKHLPNLEQLKVKFRIEERMIQPTLYVENVTLCKTLHRVTFTGCTKYFEYFEHFFTTFGSTIKYLTINIDLMYNIVDGKRLEQELLSKMPCLLSLNLIIHSIIPHCDPIEIETFQNSSWQNFNPIVYWNDIHAHQHTIFTLPYRSNRCNQAKEIHFKHLSNDFISSCVSNRVVSLCFEHVRILSLISTTPLTLEIFEFIEKGFPNIKTLELTNPLKSSRFQHERKRNRNISHISDIFLLNNSLQLPSITKFCFLLRSQYDDYKIFRRFLYLLPSLVYLQMFIGRSLFHEILIHEHEDNFIRCALNRIKLLQRIRFYDEKNLLNNEELHILFPNAQILFDYGDLYAIDLLKIFSDFKSYRLQTLIQPFISRLDVSQESDEWIENYLSNVLTKYKIIALRLQMNHLVMIPEHLLSINIQSMEVINWDVLTDFSKKTMIYLRQNLQKLSLVQPNDNESSDLPDLLFRSDSQLKHLIIKDCTLYFFNDDIEICTRLTHLSIELEGMNPLFILIQHLPNLQKLKVKIQSQECIVQTAPNTNGVKPCNKLHSVTFTGWIKYFVHLESFFDTFGSTIEYLSLNIDSQYHLFDGKRLEHGILDKMPRLSSLNLIIFSSLVDNDPIEIETFQSFTWQNFNPIVYWNDVRAQQHTLFTLPYKSDKFEYFSNDFVSNCVSNQSVSICFKRVRTLSLIATTPLNLETFLFIEKIFPNITTIKLTHWIISSLDENENEEDRNVTIMSEDLLLDNSLQLPTVTKFCISLWFPFNDYKIFRRFIQIFPNLICLELDIEPSLLHDILKYEHEDKFVKTILARIEQLNITYMDEKNTLTDAEIYYLFPNVKNLVKQNCYDSG